jgi:hypothetical protein
LTEALDEDGSGRYLVAAIRFLRGMCHAWFLVCCDA